MVQEEVVFRFYPSVCHHHRGRNSEAELEDVLVKPRYLGKDDIFTQCLSLVLDTIKPSSWPPVSAYRVP